MAYQKLTPEQSAEQLAQRIALAQQRIETAVAALQSGSQWRDYLFLQSRLHTYSARNVWLLSVQCRQVWEKGLVPTPWPTYVAGFATWRALGRSVDKGQRGLQILAPNRHHQRSAVDGDGNTRALGRGQDAGPGERVESRQVIKGFRVEHVWAAEQTSGAPLPEPPTPTLLQGQAPDGLWDTIVEQVAARGYAVRLVPSAEDLGGANGRVTWDSMLVEVRADMDDAAKVKSLLHEWGHCLLHHPATIGADDPERRRPSRGAMEVEAESVAFIVADAHGMATGDYSFPYVCTWAGADGTKTVQAVAARVAAAAKAVITASTAWHTPGGRVPDLDPAAAAAGHRWLGSLSSSELDQQRLPGAPAAGVLEVL